MLFILLSLLLIAQASKSKADLSLTYAELERVTYDLSDLSPTLSIPCPPYTLLECVGTIEITTNTHETQKDKFHLNVHHRTKGWA